MCPQYVSVLRVPVLDEQLEALNLDSVTQADFTEDGPTGKLADAAEEWKMVRQ